jgi:hypothetical protein
MRRVPQLIVMGLALAAAAACSDSTSSRLMAPTDGSSASKSPGTTSATYTSSGGVVARTYQGNTNGEGGATCSALGFGSNGTKIDGAYSRTIAGYQITISADKQSLSFAPVAGTTPTSVVLAVIVKGGTSFNVYDYSGSIRLSDGGLVSPANGGGGTPQISHYVVCVGPRPVTPPTLTKTLTAVFKSGTSPGSMIPDPDWTPGQTTIVIPIGETRWLHYDVQYTLPSGVTGTITENKAEVCGTLGTFILQCSFDLAPTSNGIYSWTVASGAGTVMVPIDLGGGGGGSCGDQKFVNTAKLTPSIGAPVYASHEITVRVVCAPAITLTKTLGEVLMSGSTPGSMIPDPNWQPGQTTVVIPIGETRWLHYDVSYSLPAGVTGTITENSTQVCGTLGTFVLQCSFNLAPTSNGVYSWSVGGTGTVMVPIDLGGGGGGSCGDQKFTNTARLTTASGATASASHEITVRVLCN